MAFVLPTFNLTANIWHYATWFGNFPSVIPVPDATTPCNLALGRRVTEGELDLQMWLLVPALTDLRGEQNENLGLSHGDIVEVVPGSGRYYGVFRVDDIGKGFANEHRFGRLTIENPFKVLLPPWPLPYP